MGDGRIGGWHRRLSSLLFSLSLLIVALLECYNAGEFTSVTIKGLGLRLTLATRGMRRKTGPVCFVRASSGRCYLPTRSFSFFFDAAASDPPSTPWPGASPAASPTRVIHSLANSATDWPSLMLTTSFGYRLWAYRGTADCAAGFDEGVTTRSSGTRAAAGGRGGSSGPRAETGGAGVDEPGVGEVKVSREGGAEAEEAERKRSCSSG